MEGAGSSRRLLRFKREIDSVLRLRVLSLRLRVLVARSLLRRVVALRFMLRRVRLRQRQARVAGLEFDDLHWISSDRRRSRVILTLSAASVCAAATAIMLRQHEPGNSTPAGTSGMLAREASTPAEAVRDRDVSQAGADAPLGQGDALSSDRPNRHATSREKPDREGTSTRKRMQGYRDLREYMLRP